MLKQSFSKILAVVLFVCCSQAYSGRAQVNEQPPESPGFFYIIQKGDTLWDLSKRFYNDQWTWPGLWEMNDEIKNPHWIFPGKKIRIFLTDTLKEKPPLALPLKEDPGPPKITLSRAEPFFNYPGMDSLGFIRKKPIDALGKIIGSQGDNLMMAVGDTIYIKPGRNMRFVPGQEYRIISTQPLSTKFNKERFNGVKHTIPGIVQAIAVEDKYTTARITRSFNPAATGDLIAPFEPSSGKIQVAKRLENINARILCSLADDAILSEHKIAFINRGDDHGITPGQTYTLFEEKEPISISFATYRSIGVKDRAMGKVIVLHTERTASTVLVLSCTKEFCPGTRVN